MRMSYGEFISLQDKDQANLIKVETIQQAIEAKLSGYGYVADDEDKMRLDELITNIVNKSQVKRGFREMSLDDYDEANKIGR